jgi:hypothetical protein
MQVLKVTASFASAVIAPDEIVAAPDFVAVDR